MGGFSIDEKLILSNMNDVVIVPTLFDYWLSDKTDANNIVSMDVAKELFTFFETSALFNWQDNHNGCEARADALCVILDEWKIPNYKAWVFSGHYLKNHVGGLKANWYYHVAAMLQVKEEDTIINYVIDPATANCLQTIEDWAAGVTDYPHSYHLIKESKWYVFSNSIVTTGWYRRNKQNRKWMIQGIAGINGLTAKGKTQLCFNKGRIKNTWRKFEELKRNNPFINKP